jgi:hypothetical protein
MRYRNVAQLTGEADVLLELPPLLSRQARLERWAEALARQPGHRTHPARAALCACRGSGGWPLRLV